ncbi:phosphoadenosine phosphosulfate reductase family protein [Klebsiella pneumoniae]|nr:phosphoadenosine phosphosulfate reductase family protein [Klebsiella pneumoniae]
MTASIAGIRKISVRSCGTTTTRQINKGESIRVFPLSNWTEQDIWQYIWLENIDIVPLYPRCGTTGSGTRRYVDDD